VGTQLYEGERITWWDQAVYALVNIVLQCDVCHSKSCSHAAHQLTIVWNPVHRGWAWAIRTWAQRGDPLWVDAAWGGEGAEDPMNEVNAAQAQAQVVEEQLVVLTSEDEEDEEDEAEYLKADEQEDWSGEDIDVEEEGQDDFGDGFGDGEHDPDVEEDQQEVVWLGGGSSDEEGGEIPAQSHYHHFLPASRLPPDYGGGGMGGTIEAAVLEPPVVGGPVVGEPINPAPGTSA